MKLEEINSLRIIIDPALMRITGVVEIRTEQDKNGKTHLLIGIERRKFLLGYKIRKVMQLYPYLRYKIKVL